ncbi:unnamed protein product, partial [Meganyctiphanes norvegica]
NPSYGVVLGRSPAYELPGQGNAPGSSGMVLGAPPTCSIPGLPGVFVCPSPSYALLNTLGIRISFPASYTSNGLLNPYSNKLRSATIEDKLNSVIEDKRNEA